MGFVVFRTMLFFRHPKHTKMDGLLFLKPFTDDVWLYVIAFGGVSILMLCSLVVLEKRLLSTRPSNEILTTIQLSSEQHDNTTRRIQRRMKINLILKKLRKRFQCGLMLLCGDRHQLLTSQFQTVTLLLESVLFYIGLICQQG